MVLFKTFALVFALYSSITCAPVTVLEEKIHSMKTNDNQVLAFSESASKGKKNRNCPGNRLTI